MSEPKFCSMKITQDVRDYADKMTDNEKADLERGAREAEEGMKAKSAEFLEKGGEIYVGEGES